MKKKFWMPLIAAMTMFASCQDEEIVNEQMEIKAVISEAIDSRTAIDDYNDYGSSVGVLWLPNENIGVYSSYNKNVKFTSTNKSSTGEATFRGLMLGTPKYAYYPYSVENNGVSYDKVKGNVPQSQSYSHVYKELAADYKVGLLEKSQLFGATFEFTRLVCLWKFQVNATGSSLEGQTLRSISIKVNNNRQITGKFTMNLSAQTLDLGSYESGNDSLYMAWSSGPVLSSGSSHIGYVTCLPDVRQNDEYQINIKTDTHIATFTHVSKATHQSNGLYIFDLNLSERDMVVKQIGSEDDEPEQPEAAPVKDMKISSFKFEVAKNQGKILPGKVVGNSSTYKPTYNANYYGDAVSCTIDEENKKIKLYLPYLNNRKLVPTFEITEGTALYCEAGEIISGETEVDFSQFKQVAIVDFAIGEGVVYDVELTNSGLPVVVINQGTSVTSTESNSDYKKASEAWYAATKTQWVPKDGPWTVDEGKGGDISRDNFMVYNADGTPAITDKNGAILSEPLFSGTRLRGNVTQQMPKKAFAVKLDKKSGVLDMKPHKRWVLLANWKDRTLMRNAVAFGIAKKFKEVFPNDGIEWNPSGQHVELVYNGVHVGNYYLCEQIKIDGNRLDINDPYDKDDAYSGNPEGYGYLLECDDAYDEDYRFLTKKYIPFLFKDDANADMLNYASNFVRGLEEKITPGKYSETYDMIDYTSMVDFLLIQDLMMNSEMKHPKSCYSYINNGKFYAGPIWDFDWNTLPVSKSYSEEGYDYTTSMLTKASVKSSSSYPTSANTSDANYLWYTFLTKDATFTALAAERWGKVSGAIQSFVTSEIPAIKAKIAKSEAENNAMWPVDSKSNPKRSSNFGIGSTFLGQTFSCGYCGDEGSTFDNAISTLQSTLNTRISGMNKYVNNKTWK